jgi:RHS repeat-associated protein
LREYVWADGTPIAILDTMGVPLTPAELIFTNGFDNAVAATTMTYYVHTDQLDTPRVVTTTTGTVVWNWPWAGNPFGEAAPNIQTMTMNLRFPGQYYDQETELNYNYFRDYEPNTGRYVESDPIGLQGGLTTYSYVNSQPLRSTDSKGLVKCGCYSGGPGFRLITGTDRIGDAICDFWCTCSCPRKNAIAEKFSFGFSMNIGNSDRATCLNISFAVTTDSIFDRYLNPNTPPRIAQDELEKNAKKHCTTCGYWNE